MRSAVVPVVNILQNETKPAEESCLEFVRLLLPKRKEQGLRYPLTLDKNAYSRLIGYGVGLGDANRVEAGSLGISSCARPYDRSYSLY